MDSTTSKTPRRRKELVSARPNIRLRAHVTTGGDEDASVLRHLSEALHDWMERKIKIPHARAFAFLDRAGNWSLSVIAQPVNCEVCGCDAERSDDCECVCDTGAPNCMHEAWLIGSETHPNIEKAKKEVQQNAQRQRAYWQLRG